jgi:hypothetical protein
MLKMICRVIFCLSFTACQFGGIVNPPSFPTEIRLEAGSKIVTTAGNLNLTAKVRYGGAFVGTVRTRVVFYDGDLSVGETVVSDSLLDSNLSGEYAFQVSVSLNREQNGVRSYKAVAFYDQDQRRLETVPITVQVAIP